MKQTIEIEIDTETISRQVAAEIREWTTRAVGTAWGSALRDRVRDAVTAEITRRVAEDGLHERIRAAIDEGEAEVVREIVARRLKAEATKAVKGEKP